MTSEGADSELSKARVPVDRRNSLSIRVDRPVRLSRLIAWNFAILGVAELLCRAFSVLITVSLYRRLGTAGFGRIEFSFNVVFWLVLIVRDCFETIVTREIARRPNLTRGFVNHVLAVKLIFATGLFGLLTSVGRIAFENPIDYWVLSLYGLLLFSTALGLDFVYRAHESTGIVAVSLVFRTTVYCLAILFLVNDTTRVILVPIALVIGELSGIGLVWFFYILRFGVPRLKAGGRFSRVLLQRGRTVGLIHFCQAIIVSADLFVVGVMNGWDDVGRYSGPHRVISAVMAFGFIFQQVVFPPLSKKWRSSAEEGRGLFDLSVRLIMTGFIPIAIGGTVLSEPLVRFLFRSDYEHSIVLLAVGIWRAPLLCLAFLYQSALIAMNRESSGVRLLVWGAVGSVPLASLLHWQFGLIGASSSVILVGVGLVTAGYLCLAREGRAPRLDHHVGLPILASLGMVPASLFMLRYHVIVAVGSGALAYLVVLKCLGGLDFRSRERTSSESKDFEARSLAVSVAEDGRTV